MNRIDWRQVGVFAAILLVIFLVGITASPLLFGAYRGWGTRGPGMIGRGWSQGWYPFGGGMERYPGGFFGGTFGWLFMLAATLFPVGLLVLLILGIVGLVRILRRPPSEAAPSPQSCLNCGRSVDADWRHCPHCGEELPGPA